MQIRRLRLVNFRQHEDTELVLGAGLTGIVGPNGAGKTTLLEAIAYAIYGTPAARGTRDSIRRRGAPPRSPVRVELEFGLGPHGYRVVRSLNQAELYLDGDPSPIANSLGAVTEKVTRLLGMTREEFFNTYFTGQKELAVMAAMTAPERARFLSRVLGYERLRQVQDRLKERRTRLKSALETLEGSLLAREELDREEASARERAEAARRREAEGRTALSAAEAEVARVRPLWTEQQQRRERALSLEGELRVADHRVSNRRESFTALDRRLVEALDARSKVLVLETALAPLAALREERDGLERLAEVHAAKKGHLELADELRRALGAVTERLGQLPTPEAAVATRKRAAREKKALGKAEKAAEAARTSWVRETEAASAMRRTLLDQYQDLTGQRERLVEAGADGNCPTCGRPLGDDFASVLELLDQQMEDVRQNGRFYKGRIDQLKVEPEELRFADREQRERERAANEAEMEARRLEEQAAQRPTLTAERDELQRRLEEVEAQLKSSETPYDQARHQAVRREIETLDETARLAERFRALADQAEGLVVEAENAEKALSEAEATATQLRAAMTDLGYDEEAYRAARDAAEAVERERHECDKRLVAAQAEVHSADDALATVARRRKEREEMERRIQSTTRDLRLHQELDRAFTDLRTDLNAALRPELSDLASTFVRELTNDRYSDLELDEDYLAILMEDGQPKPVVSGGEEDIANLALRLAISQMIAERAGQPLSLLVLDEIFGSLDEERRGAVLELLRGLADRFPQVILITHIETVREGFDRVIRVSVDRDRGVAVARDDRQTEDPGAAA